MVSNTPPLTPSSLSLSKLSSGWKSNADSPAMTNVTQWFNALAKPPTDEEWRGFQEKLFQVSLTPEYIQKNPEQVRVYTQEIQSTQGRTYDAYVSGNTAFSQFDVKNDLQRIKAKTLVQHGAKDQVQPVQNGRDIQSLIPNSKYIEYADGGHLLYVTNPDALKDTLNFLNGQ